MPSPTAASTGGDLTLLTYNVHALPSFIAGDNPQARLPLIGAHVHQYDVALVQEIWLYRDRLTKWAGDSIVIPGKGPHGGFDRLIHPFGTGILFLSKLPRSQVLESESDNFGVCEGRWRHANDCWARKGYLRVRVAVGDRLVDFYTLHLDAGESGADRAARAKQLAVLRDRIARATGEGALIIAGDFNLAYETPADRALVEQFVKALRLTESGARAQAHWQENIDYIFYRSGPSTQIQLLDAHEDTSFVDSGKSLSDHPAIAARFHISAR